MKIKVRIKTPKGNATSAGKVLKPLIIGLRKVETLQFQTNKDDSLIEWTLEADLSKAIKIQNQVQLYDKLVKSIMGNKKFKKQIIKKKFSKEQYEEVEEMLDNQTEVKIIKESDTDWNLKTLYEE